MTVPPDLIAGLEKMDGWGSAALDADVLTHLGWEVTRNHGQLEYAMRRPSMNYRRWQSIPRITRSFDAVVALINKEFPGWGMSMSFDDDSAVATIYSHVSSDKDDHEGRAKTAPCALLIAYLRAREAGQ